MKIHELSEKEWRNGWQYMHCACGAVIGPFSTEDYAGDAFECHASGNDHLIGNLGVAPKTDGRERK